MASIQLKRVLIAAMARNRVIGLGNGMPWHIPAEYQHFLSCVYDQTMIMGRRSWEIFGADVNAAHTIVVTRRDTLEGTRPAPGLEAALAIAKTYGRTIYVAGGASVYRQAIDNNLIDEMLLSIIDLEPEGDTFFPMFDEDRWPEVERQPYDDHTITRRRRRDDPTR